MGEAEDEDGPGEVLEPGPAGRERVADEIGRELPRADQTEGRARTDRPRCGAGLADRLRYARPALCSAA
jgi:hypothetical protein